MSTDHNYGEGDGSTTPKRLEAKTLRELENLFVLAQAARDTYSEAIKATAKETGIKGSALRKVVRATCTDTLPDLHQELDAIQALLPEAD